MKKMYDRAVPVTLAVCLWLVGNILTASLPAKSQEVSLFPGVCKDDPKIEGVNYFQTSNCSNNVHCEYTILGTSHCDKHDVLNEGDPNSPCVDQNGIVPKKIIEAPCVHGTCGTFSIVFDGNSSGEHYPTCHGLIS